MCGTATVGCASERILSNSRATAAETCSQKCIPLLRRRAFRDSRTPCVDHHAAVDARSARIAKMCGTASVDCVSERISEQLSRESCS
eukprot:11009318-Lingulodinium_polyedra.AAC.1